MIDEQKSDTGMEVETRPCLYTPAMARKKRMESPTIPIMGEWLYQNKVSIIAGHPGAGKSTLARSISLAFLTGRGVLGMECN